MKLKNLIINQNSRIIDALKSIDSSSMRITFICDRKKKLLGVITDGDIRRFLLKGGSVDSSIKEIINFNPIIAEAGRPKNFYKRIINENDLVALPIVNKQGILIDIESQHSLSYKFNIDATIMIMAGGFGTRLRPLTDNTPKPMLDVGGKPLLEKIIDDFQEYGFDQFKISTHFLPDIIKNYFQNGSSKGVSIEYLHEKKPLGTAGALSLIKEDIASENIIVINGDIFTNLDYLTFLKSHTKSGKQATICTKLIENYIPYGVLSVSGDGFEILEKPTFNYEINTGIYVLNKDVLSLVPKNKKIDFPELLTKIDQKFDGINKYMMHDFWLDIGSMDDLERARRLANENF